MTSGCRTTPFTTDWPRGRTVLVTGATGFIGTHLTRRLHDAGVDLHLVSRRPVAPAPSGDTWWQADLRDATRTRHLVRSVRPEMVFHLAGQASAARDLDAVLPTLHNNIEATVNLLTALASYGKPRVVLAGSMEVPHPGERPTAASSPYALTKWAVTAYSQLFYQLYGLPAVVLRIAMAFGPAQLDRMKLVPYVIESLLAGRRPKLGSGNRYIDWVYVDDVVDAFLAAATVPAAPGQSLDIGSGTPVSIRETVALIRRLVDTDVTPDYGMRGDRAFDSARIADLTGASEVLGWQPQTGLDEGMARTVAWYRERHVADRDGRPGPSLVIDPICR